MRADRLESSDPPPPDYQLVTWMVLGTGLVIVIGLLFIRMEHQPDTTRAYASRPLPTDEEPALMSWEPREDEYIPCSDCHEDEPANRTPRQLDDEHDEMDFAHGDLWCLHCHDAGAPERLHLADETGVAFENSWRLCTQCHAKKLADWRAGVHGKRTGHWRGPKQYRTCVSCHDPHSPPFQPVAPEPPPARPGRLALGANVVASAVRKEAPRGEP